MELKSKALEANIADYHVDVEIDPRYAVLQEVMSKYYGIMEGLNTFLKELSHPYRNWGFIVQEARSYSLDYFHLLRNHPKGIEAARRFVEVFAMVIESQDDQNVRTDAADNLLLFLQKIVTDSGPDLERFMPVIDDTFDQMSRYPEDMFSLFVRSFYQTDRLAESILKKGGPDGDYGATNRLLLKYHTHTYSYWVEQGDPLEWFLNEATGISDQDRIDTLFEDISLERIKGLYDTLEAIRDAEDESSIAVLEKLIGLPNYSRIVDAYRQIPRRLLDAGWKKDLGNRWKIIFLFHNMKIAGLSMIHEETLRDINRTLTWLIAHEDTRSVKQLIEKTFGIIRAQTRQYPATALDCVMNAGKGVFKTDDIDLINFFIDEVIDLGFQTPMIEGVGNDWQIKANSTHIQNIRTWLELIELNPKRSIRLLSTLIIHLSLSGVFIKDTDLFPRDITKFLNSDIEAVYNLAKQLARLFPVFFNDIGAEGRLRDISTEIDETSHRKDQLIHFLRKQSHVESSNRIIDFISATLRFWETRDKDPLSAFVPPNIFDQIETTGTYIDGVHNVIGHLKSRGVVPLEGFLTVTDEELELLLDDLPEGIQTDPKRVMLAIAFYKMLHQKYNLEFVEMDRYLAQLRGDTFPGLERLKAAVAEPDPMKKLSELLGCLEVLKELILSEQQYEIREDIYKKRHFTVDIPSMYGSYYELKFDALGLTFRIESMVNVLFEEAVQNIDLSLITKAALYQIYERLMLFNRALKLDGIASVEIDEQLDLLSYALEVRGFTFTQYLDIFRQFSRAVNNIINDHFSNIHEQNLNKILSGAKVEKILPKYLPREAGIDAEKLKHRISEVFSRERIAMSLGLQQLDLFLTRIQNTIYQQADRLHKDKLQQLLLYDPEHAMTAIGHSDDDISSVIQLGNKGFNLVKLHRLGFPVPPGFIVTTEVFRHKDMIFSYMPAELNFQEQVAQQISDLERATGNVLGDADNPLLLSVRSGAAISQPGMMDTFLNVGINELLTDSMADRTGNTWFAWDNYRRFMQSYGMAHELERDDFDAIINDFKKRLGTPYKREFTGEQMRDVALAYKEYIRSKGLDIIEDPLDQLNMVIKSVFSSWDSTKAKAYRSIMGISEDWGTAVTIQAMVFGNATRQSGTGVLFTHNPRWSGDTMRIWGDFTIGNQGEDVVSGLVHPLPISVFQQEIQKRETDQTLETDFPEIYAALNEWVNELIYTEGWSPQEIEFTFEGPSRTDLFLLQARDMSMREVKEARIFEPGALAGTRLLGHGIGMSGGAMSGRAVFNLEEIHKWRTDEPDTSLILIRGDTVPDDIREIDAADGVVTARGGVTSHAAVVAHRLEKTCIVGCGELVCYEKESRCLFGQEWIRSGDFISIDGQSGTVAQGFTKVRDG